MSNTTILTGNLGAAVETHTFDSGKVKATFSIATEVRDAQGNKTTVWHRVSLWGKRAERAASLLYKGAKVLVHGEDANAKVFRQIDGRRAGATGEVKDPHAGPKLEHLCHVAREEQTALPGKLLMYSRPVVSGQFRVCLEGNLSKRGTHLPQVNFRPS